MVEKSRCPQGREEVAFWFSGDELRQWLESDGGAPVQAELLSLEYQGAEIPKRIRVCVKSIQVESLGWFLQTVANLAVMEEDIECPGCGWENIKENK